MKVEDPVCGRSISLDQARASEDHDGWAYFFCSPDCHEAFKANPQDYSNDRVSAVFQTPPDTARPSRKA